ncbi:hypothetical protein G6L37_05945 [Agrobacterium rubi]|nr:hypothetical protein [Agrobacterium rubi]NTF24902.1 hypothetical protein [Agrobacterium rubi]
MTNATTVVMDSEKSKLAAHAIKKRFEELNAPIKLNHAYEALAIAHRHANWATMKVAIGGKPSVAAADTFAVGISRRYEQRQSIMEQVSIPSGKALNHFHAFSTSHEARHDLLRGLSANAMRTGRTSVFVEPVSDAGTKYKLINGLLRHATAHGRRDDFFVLDLSAPPSRLGNTCNILDAMTPDAVAEFLLYDNHVLKNIENADLMLAYCVENLISSKDGSEPSVRITIDSLCRELELLDIHGFRESIVDERTRLLMNYTAQGLPARLLKYLRAFSKHHQRLLDDDTPWGGFSTILQKPQTLLIFVDDKGSPLADILLREVVNALLTVIEQGDGRPGSGDMLLLNDVDFLKKDVAKRARKNGICLVIADQCPMPPPHLDTDPTLFRSEAVEEGSQRYSNHQLITETGEIQVSPGVLMKTDRA